MAVDEQVILHSVKHSIPGQFYVARTPLHLDLPAATAVASVPRRVLFGTRPFSIVRIVLAREVDVARWRAVHTQQSSMQQNTQPLADPLGFLPQVEIARATLHKSRQLMTKCPL